MQVIVDIPDDLSSELGAKFDNLGRAALEALAAQAYDKDALSLEQVRRLLRLPSQWEARSVLERHGVWPGTTVLDALSDLKTLEDLRVSAPQL